MRILLTGLCTVHWGRLQYGNVGNYYITEATVRELHRVFPEAELVTTFQMTDEFCSEESVTCLPMELFYAWTENDVPQALRELGIAEIYAQTGKLVDTTPFIDEVMKCDLMLDFSGEMWGDHAEPVGKDRFLVCLLKDRVAELLGTPVALLAGSQGPFSDERTLPLAQLVLGDFLIAANREAMSKQMLADNGFDVSRVESFACPAFLFDPKPAEQMQEILEKERIRVAGKRTIGFILCGFNMLKGPYDLQPRDDDEFVQFAELVEYSVNTLGARVVLLSHQNGFELPPNFKLINGRDYPVVKQLQQVVEKRGLADMEDVICIDRPYVPRELKGIIGQFDMFISGRVHGLVAALSQCVPSVLVTRGFGPVSHRNIGFARSVGIEDYIADPRSAEDMKEKVRTCWERMPSYREYLEKTIPSVKDTARRTFDRLREAYDAATGADA